MSIQRIFFIEQQLSQKLEVNKQKLIALNKIKKYQSQLNHSFEIAPKGGLSTLYALFSGLKGEHLSEDEIFAMREVYGV